MERTVKYNYYTNILLNIIDKVIMVTNCGWYQL